jgi:hypothetical protein
MIADHTNLLFIPAGLVRSVVQQEIHGLPAALRANRLTPLERDPGMNFPYPIKSEMAAFWQRALLNNCTTRLSFDQVRPSRH